MSNAKTKLAIQNNAAWCLRVWQSHGLQTFEQENLCFCPADVPDFYPNIVTLQPGGASIVEEIGKVRALGSGQKFSVKDSFADLDLKVLDLHRLFDANWLYLSSRHNKLSISELHWTPANSETELAEWAAQWDGREAGSEPIFLPSLLKDPSVEFWGGRSDGKIQAGFVSNITGPVVGISNIFGLYEDCIAHAVHQFSNYDIVSYENAETLSQATTLGFEVIGDLSIWIV